MCRYLGRPVHLRMKPLWRGSESARLEYADDDFDDDDDDFEEKELKDDDNEKLTIAVTVRLMMMSTLQLMKTMKPDNGQ